MIMKNYFMKSSMMLMAVSAALASCTQEDVLQNTPTQPSDNELKLSVSTQDFVSDAQGRAITNNNDKRTSDFENGDQMGLYIFSEDGEVLCDNLLYTYTDGKWTADKTIYQYKNAQYVAYFPYCKDLSRVAVAENNSESDAEGSIPSITESVTKNITDYFTTNILNTISQTDAETYEQADLMVATATQVTGENVILALKHQFSMIELNVPCRKYITQAGGFEYAAPVKMKDVEINGKTELYRAAEGVYRMIVVPETTPTIYGSVEYDALKPIYFSSSSAQMTPLAAGTFTQFNVTYDDPALKDLDKDEATGRYIRPLQPGDYYYSDGTIYPYDASKAKQPFKEGCIGVIFEVGTGVPNTPWTHGSVLALKSLGQAKWSASRCTVEGNVVSLDNYTSAKHGYEVTQELVKMENFLWNDAANLAYNLGKNESDSQYAAPISSSGWYLPSLNDWVSIIGNLGGDTDFTFSSTSTQTGDVVSNIKGYLEKIDENLANDYFLKYTLSSTEQAEDQVWALELSGETFKVLNRQKVQNQTSASNKFGACAVLSF